MSPNAARDLAGPTPAREVFAAILGTGFSGLGAAAELKRAGIDDLVLLERAPSLGGTWRDNVYPGCACDVPSHLYSFSFAPKADWSRAYAPQPEIRAYLEEVADRLDLRRHVLFEREVVAARWDEARARWELETRAGERFAARVLVAGVGALSNPAVPELRGIERFGGPAFHSARWDHAVDLRGKRVAVIGTGASAIQFVPPIQPIVDRLFLLQRTPPWILPRRDRAIPAWQRALFRAVPGARWLYRQSIYWRLEGRALAFLDRPALMRLVEREALRHLAGSVPDPVLRARLTPRYRPGCKRILLSDDYYPAVAQPNVELVTEAIAEVEPRALRLADGRRLEVDALIYGTGFRVHDYLGDLRIVGRGGVELGALWRTRRAEAYLGTMVAGFPNLFVMTGPNTGLGHTSMVVMIEGQARWTAQAVRHLVDRGAATVEVTAAAQEAYNAPLRARADATIWASGCHSWYLDPQGRNTTLWPGFTVGFRARTARLRPGDLAVRALPPAAPPASHATVEAHRATVLALPAPVPPARPRLRVRDRAEAAVAHALTRLPPRWQRRLAGRRVPAKVGGEVLAPDVQLVLSLGARLGRPGFDALPIADARRRLRRDTFLHGGRPEPVADVRDLAIPGAAGPIGARLYVPGAAPGPLLVFFHGGGFVTGDLDTHDAPCRILCRRAGVRVLSVDYRLAPEAPFPAAVDDARAALRFASANAAALGADAARVAVGGDSAGGNLAAVVALQAARDGGPAPALQLLLYPALDRSQPYPSIDAFADGYLLSRGEIAYFDGAYCPGAARDDPRLSPMCADDVSGLAPAIVVTAAFDPLRDEGEAYAERLRAAGNAVTLRRMPGLVHGFVNITGVSPTARAATLEVARLLAAALTSPGSPPSMRRTT